MLPAEIIDPHPSTHVCQFENWIIAKHVDSPDPYCVVSSIEPVDLYPSYEELTLETEPNFILAKALFFSSRRESPTTSNIMSIDVDLYLKPGDNMEILAVDTTTPNSTAQKLFDNLTQVTSTDSIIADTNTLRSHTNGFSRFWIKVHNFFSKADNDIKLEPVIRLETTSGVAIDGLHIIHTEPANTPLKQRLVIYATRENSTNVFIITTDVETWNDSITIQATNEAGVEDTICTKSIQDMWENLAGIQPDPSSTNDKHDLYFFLYDEPNFAMTHQNLDYFSTLAAAENPFQSGYITDKNGNIVASDMISTTFHGQPTGRLIMIDEQIFAETAIDQIEFPLLANQAYTVFMPIGIISTSNLK